MLARVALMNEAGPDAAIARDGLIAASVLLSPLLTQSP